MCGRILPFIGGRRPRDAGTGAWHSENELRKEYVKVQDNIKECKMPEEKIAAFLEEFPWAKQYILGSIKQVYVSRITRELLSRTPLHCSLGCGEEISFIDEAGCCIPVRRTLFRHRTLGNGRSILSALHSLELEKAPPVRFILSYLNYHWVYRGYSGGGGGRLVLSPGLGSVIIYKPPQQLDAVKWAREQIDADKRELRKNLT
ncbi:MAG: hypothetical protein A3B25_00085 [Candidatus Ryanbacteria bacterium RIFCSPLOWO2_01_FULL_48_26]|uniref:Uncharacterized protein n=1 Tax=Candidatus Ryanbacteria bacterium RIFCSPLOWO2_01_FULL_48_26 TaxID=1802126 RepID=A0A1G2GTD2_9BACT|nr:MAG: hypothetical protein A3B25_00085 [Candidatus Ryanbacteria bacterium RIFCSPLOWO2_01_FULL_48_26]